jgi:hypothetical protein
MWTELFTTPLGWAALITGAAALIYLGADGPLGNVPGNSVFKVRNYYDKRNTQALAASVDPLRDPFNKGITSVSMPIKSDYTKKNKNQ